MDTMQVRPLDACAHETIIINACDFDPKRHAELKPDAEIQEDKPKPASRNKPKAK